MFGKWRFWGNKGRIAGSNALPADEAPSANGDTAAKEDPKILELLERYEDRKKNPVKMTFPAAPEPWHEKKTISLGSPSKPRSRRLSQPGAPRISSSYSSSTENYASDPAPAMTFNEVPAFTGWVESVSQPSADTAPVMDGGGSDGAGASKDF